MPRLILLNKPYDVLCQFTDEAGRRTLKDIVRVPGVYAAGRLDRDSEGLVVLSDHGPTIARIADPRRKTVKRYWAQVEGEPSDEALSRFRAGLDLKDGRTLPAGAERIDEPKGLWPRDPPIRFRASIPTAWLDIALREGRNRQVRRMTAAIGHPTLRLIRHAVGEWTLGGLPPGAWREA